MSSGDTPPSTPGEPCSPADGGPPSSPLDADGAAAQSDTASPPQEVPGPATEPDTKVVTEVVEEAAAPEIVTESAEELAALRQEVDEAKDRALRLQAEFENYRKRTVRERSQARDGATEDVTRAFLAAVDNCDRAVAAAMDHGVDEEHLAGWQLIHQQLYDVLRTFGVEPMAVIGQPFDPQYHDALAEIHDDAIPPGHVAAEVERGYMIGGRVLRTAKVTVCRGPADAPDANDA